MKKKDRRELSRSLRDLGYSKADLAVSPDHQQLLRDTIDKVIDAATQAREEAIVEFLTFALERKPDPESMDDRYEIQRRMSADVTKQNNTEIVFWDGDPVLELKGPILNAGGTVLFNIKKLWAATTAETAAKEVMH